MKKVLGLIYIPVVSRSVARVKEFRRCPEHGNLLAYEGRALTVDEFNKAAPKVLGQGATSIYGVQPIAKLVEIEVADEEPVEGGAPAASVPPVEAKPAPVIDLPKFVIEPAGDGFVLVNYDGDEARYMGVSLALESDVSLVIPFATEDDARGACPGVLVPKAPEPVVDGDELEAADDDSLVGDTGASEPPSDEAPAPSEPAASAPPPATESVQPVIDPKTMRDAVVTHQAQKRAAKAAKNAPKPKKVTPPAGA